MRYVKRTPLQSGNNKINRALFIRPVSDVLSMAGHPRDVRVPFPLKYAISLLEEYTSCQTKLLDCMTDNMDLDELLEFSVAWRPDIVFLAPTTLENRLTLDYAGRLKKAIPVIIAVIGQDATASPHYYINQGSVIDFVIRGEAEFSCLNLVEALNRGGDPCGVKGIFTKSQTNSEMVILDDLDRLPFPTYDDKEFKKYIFYYPLSLARKVMWGHILTSRGCPYDCIFCSQLIRESYGRKVRLRVAANVISEIRYLMGKGANIIAFDDDNFTTVRQHVIDICKEIKNQNLKIKWIAHARVDNCDEELLGVMKEAGCILLRFGVESGSNQIIKNLRKTIDVENWTTQVRKIFRLARQINLSTASLFLLANPYETTEDVEKSIALAKEIKPDILQISFFTPYAGSVAYEEFKDLINRDSPEVMYHYNVPSLNFSKIPGDKLKAYYSKFYKDVLFTPGYVVRHLSNYGLFYVYNRNVFCKLLEMLKLI